MTAYDETFADRGIDVKGKTSGQHNVVCPQCSQDRKKKSNKCLSVNLNKGVWYCHHCGWHGSLKTHNGNGKAHFENRTTLSNFWIDWFLRRNISQDVITKMKISEGVEWMPQVGKEVPVIQFPYFKDGKLINTKFRDAEKNFKLTTGAPLILYNHDVVKSCTELFIVEGEIDALSLIQTGIHNVVSVPNGAHSTRNNMKYLNLRQLKHIERFNILTDADEPGEKLAYDLAEKLGRDRCVRIKLADGCKDPNEALCKTGRIELSRGSQLTSSIVSTIKLPHDIAFNIITHGLTFEGKPLSNKKLHDLWWDTPKRPGFDNYYHQLIALAPAWNPYTEFFNVPWSGVDQFSILEKYIDTDDGFVKELERHIIRGINQLLGEPGSKTHHINRFAFILQGGMNIGKSELLRRLTLRDVLPGFSSEIDMGQSKTEVHRLLCQCVNLINEEIDSVTAQEVRSLKPIISYSGGSLRLPYDRTPTQMQRIATLWGSVNPCEFLLETNDRWIVFEIRNIDFGYTAAVDFADLWRQCYAAWKVNPLAGELTKSEVDALSEKASAHLIVSPLEQFVRSRYVGDASVQPMTMHEIKMDVISSYPNVNDKLLGRVMTAAFGKFRAGRQMINGVRGTMYCVRVKTNYQ